MAEQKKTRMNYLDYAIAHTVSTDPNHWYCWSQAVEKDLGHSLDGDLEKDGYSKSDAFETWRNGHSVFSYTSRVQIVKPGPWRTFHDAVHKVMLPLGLMAMIAMSLVNYLATLQLGI